MSIVRIAKVIAETLAVSMMIAAAQAQTGEPTPKAPASSSLIPPGPFSSWSAEAREHVPGKVRGACVIAAGMGSASFDGPKDLKIELMMAQTYTCLLRQMPSDWPDRADARARALKHYENARALDRSLAIPDLPN